MLGAQLNFHLYFPVCYWVNLFKTQRKKNKHVSRKIQKDKPLAQEITNTKKAKYKKRRVIKLANIITKKKSGFKEYKISIFSIEEITFVWTNFTTDVPTTKIA